MLVNDWKYTGVQAHTPCICYIWHFCQNWLSCAYILSKIVKVDLLCSICTKQKQQKLKLIENILAYELVRRRMSSYAVHFFTLFNLVKNDFPVLINCLNCQSGLILSKMYETDAKEPLNISKYTGVRARTPCIFF